MRRTPSAVTVRSVVPRSDLFLSVPVEHLGGPSLEHPLGGAQTRARQRNTVSFEGDTIYRVARAAGGATWTPRPV
ncbi:hypothetical protein ACFCVP_18800 [Bacillus altitudinis]|uniref:hypothetical protein n=1 Tax=Bacillus altitudinis TaxID=293387 RepID=UPI0035D73D77